MSSVPVVVLQLLWQISWHAAVAAGVVLVVRACAGRAVPGRWRHALWVVVLCRLAMPVAPASRASVFNLWRPADPRPTPAAVLPPAGWSVETTSTDAAPTVAPAADVPAAASPPRWPAVVTGVWLAVAAALVGRLVVANVCFQRRLTRSGRPADRALSAAFDAGRRETGWGRRAELVVTDAVATPAVCGVLWPRVLVPTAVADALPADRARLVFLHELAHVRCHDVLVDWVWAVVRSAYWFNPVVWLIGPVRRHDREVARDEMVLAVVGDAGAEAYGRTLLDLSRPGVRPAVGVGLVGLFDGRGVRDRVARIARDGGGRRGWTGAACGAAVLAVAGCASLTNPATPPHAAAPATRPAAAADPDVSSAATATTLAKLDVKLPELRFNANRLEDVIEHLREITGTKVDVHWQALKAVDVTRDTPVTARLRHITFAKALDLIFKSVGGDGGDHQLGYVVDAGVVTISTRQEFDTRTVTRRYDINDLLFLPPDFAPTIEPANDPAAGFESLSGRPLAPPTHDGRIDEVEQYVRQNVDPNSWQENGGDFGAINISPSRTSLTITQTPENHLKIRAVLDSLRASQALQVSVAARVVTVEDADVDKLPADVRKLLGSTGPPGQVGQTLTPAQADSVTGAAGVTTLAEPRLTMFSGQQAAVSLLSQQSFTEAYTAVVRPGGGGTAYEPVTKSVGFGLTAGVQGTVSPDRRSVFVTLTPTLSRLAGVTTQPWPGGPPGLVTQRPVVLTSDTRTSCSVPDGTTLLLPCGGFTPAAGEPAAVDAAVNRARRARVFLLVRPTVLVDHDRPADFPNLDRRVP